MYKQDNWLTLEREEDFQEVYQEKVQNKIYHVGY